MWLGLIAAVACTSDPTSSTSDPAEGTEPPGDFTGYGVDEDFATRGGCPTPGVPISAVYDGQQAVLVHGSTPQEAAFADQVAAFYDGLFVTPLIVRDAADLTDNDRQQHLMVVGGSDNNALLTELNGALPVWFDAGAFTFAGYRWSDPAHGVALIHPSPWAADRYVVLYAGNTFEGAWATFTIPTGTSGFQAVRGRSVLQVEGELCDDGPRWDVPTGPMLDLRDNWERWRDALDVREGTYHRFYTVPGSEADDDLDAIEVTQQDSHQALLALLEVEPLDRLIDAYLYPSLEDKLDVTDDPGNAHANDLNYEVHLLVGDGVQALGAHEDAHVVAWYRLGEAGSTLMGEGLAVMADGTWQGQTLTQWASAALADDSLPPLRALIDDFWGEGGGSVSGYGAAGALVDWLRGTYGIDAVKALYVERNLDAAFQAELGLSTAEVEAAWHGTL